MLQRIRGNLDANLGVAQAPSSRGPGAAWCQSTAGRAAAGGAAAEIARLGEGTRRHKSARAERTRTGVAGSAPRGSSSASSQLIARWGVHPRQLLSRPHSWVQRTRPASGPLDIEDRLFRALVASPGESRTSHPGRGPPARRPEWNLEIWLIHSVRFLAHGASSSVAGRSPGPHQRGCCDW